MQILLKCPKPLVLRLAVLHRRGSCTCTINYRLLVQLEPKLNNATIYCCRRRRTRVKAAQIPKRTKCMRPERLARGGVMLRKLQCRSISACAMKSPHEGHTLQRKKRNSSQVKTCIQQLQRGYNIYWECVNRDFGYIQREGADEIGTYRVFYDLSFEDWHECVRAIRIPRWLTCINSLSMGV